MLCYAAHFSKRTIFQILTSVNILVAFSLLAICVCSNNIKNSTNINIHLETYKAQGTHNNTFSSSVYVLLPVYILKIFIENAEQILQSFNYHKNATKVYLLTEYDYHQKGLNIFQRYPNINFLPVETDRYGFVYLDVIFNYLLADKSNVCILITGDSILSPTFWNDLEDEYIKCSCIPSRFFGVAQRCFIENEKMHLSNKLNLISNKDYSADVFVFSNMNQAILKIDIPPFHVGAYLWDSYITNYFSKIMPVVKIGGNCGSLRIPHKEKHSIEISRMSAENREIGEKWNLSLVTPKNIRSKIC